MKQESHMIDLGKINALRQKLSNQTKSRAHIPLGTYLCRVVDIRIAVLLAGSQERRLATLEINGGQHEGQRIEVRLKGRELHLVQDAKEKGALLEIDVFVRRLDDGREFSNVNIETIRPAGAVVPGCTTVGQQARGTSLQANSEEAGLLPAADVEQLDVAEFVTGFQIVGGLKRFRTLVNWQEEFVAATHGSAACGFEQEAYLSAYVFQGRPLAAHMEAQNLSMAGYPGPTYAPFLIFEIDGEESEGIPADAAALHQAQNLVAILLDQGVPMDDVLVFFSGGRGFHVLITTALTGARPSKVFAEVAGVFCTSLANVVCCTLDKSLYGKLQPLRSPNSRHATTGLYKVRLSLEQLFDEPIERIRDYASEPRPFTLAGFSREPISKLATLWQEAEQAVGAANAARVHTAATDENPFIYANTWSFLIRGTQEGSRAMETFKAASNLAMFKNVDHLIRALLDRPTALSGFPPQEAEQHISSALRRCRMQ